MVVRGWVQVRGAGSWGGQVGGAGTSADNKWGAGKRGAETVRSRSIIIYIYIYIIMEIARRHRSTISPELISSVG